MADRNPLETMKFSISSISTFEQCRQKFRFQYIDKIGKRTQSIEQLMGSCVHKALEILYNNVKNGRVPAIEEILDVYEKEWNEKFNDDVIIAKKEFSPEDYKNVGRKCVTDYYESHRPFDDVHIIGLETDDTLNLADGIDYYVRIDKLACKGDTFFVCDYKTNANMKKQSEADSDRQLALYAEWVRRTYNTDDVKLVWHMVRFDRDVVSQRTPEQLDSLVKEITEEIKSIKSCKDWSTSPSALCDYCEFHDMCPEFVHIVKVEKEIEEKMFTDDEGAKLVDEYVSLDSEAERLKTETEALKERRDALKEQIALYAKQFGCNSVGGTEKKANVKFEKKAKIDDDDVSKVIAKLSAEGRLGDYQKFDKGKAEKDIASGNAESISEFAEVTESPRVTFAKKK